MQTYTKINTLYKRYQRLSKKDFPTLPNEEWRKFSGIIIFGEYSDPIMANLTKFPMEASEKLDGTNSKIAFYPSTGTYKVGGKTDKAQSQSGQFEKLTEIAERILPVLREMFPPETAKFVPVLGSNNKPIYWDYSEDELLGGPNKDGFYITKLEEAPIYLYGEFYGPGIQSGGYYRKDNDFALFDINQQGWWLPRKEFLEAAEKLNIPTVPQIGDMSIERAEEIVSEGFSTAVGDSGHFAEGIVLKTPYLKDSRGNRIIVKIKYCDYRDYERVRSQFTDEEFEKFNKWYFENVEKNVL